MYKYKQNRNRIYIFLISPQSSHHIIYPIPLINIFNVTFETILYSFWAFPRTPGASRNNKTRKRRRRRKKSNKMIIMGHIISLGIMRGNCHNSHQRKFWKRESSGSGKHYETEKSFSTLPSAHQRRQFQFQFGKLQTKHMVRKYDTTQTCEGNLYAFNGEKGCQAILNITFLLLKVH